MASRRPLAFLGIVLLPIVVNACSCSAEPKPLDHVILIVVDTLRADHLSAYGYHRSTSPALEELASESVLFENVVSQSSWTWPSMVSMMTGSWLGAEVIRIPDDRTTVADFES